MTPTTTQIFDAYIEGYKNAYEHETDIVVKLDIDYALNYKTYGIEPLTEEGKKFLKYIQKLCKI